MTDAELNELSQKLFKKFARCEYALKAAGFHNGDGNAVANWCGFAISIESLFENPADPPLAEAINFILDSPPRKHMVRNNLLTWEEASRNTSSKADQILIHVRRVRNNLFHGDKSNGAGSNLERNCTLIRCSLTILDAAIQQSDIVREAYGPAAI